MLVPMNVVMLSLVSICVLFTPWLRRRGGGEGEGCACLESERRERGHREAGRDRRGPVRVVGRRHGRGRRLAAGITGVQGQGDKPPCIHKTRSATTAATGMQLKQSPNTRHSFME